MGPNELFLNQAEPEELDTKAQPVVVLKMKRTLEHAPGFYSPLDLVLMGHETLMGMLVVYCVCAFIISEYDVYDVRTSDSEASDGPQSRKKWVSINGSVPHDVICSMKNPNNR